MKVAIVTAYYPDVENKNNVEKIAEQVDKVIVCDNSPSDNGSIFCGEKVEYVFFGENLGLSAAFNKVLKDDKKSWSNDDYIVFFDQDSTIEPNHIDCLVGIYDELVQAGVKVGCLGPVYFDNSSGQVEIPKMKTPLLDKTYSVQSIITSSMVTTYGNLASIDFWNEEAFLDMADWDLCWRLLEAGMECCITERLILNHTLGQGEKKIGFFKLKVGSTIRDYYQTRDCLYLLKKKYTPLKYKCRFILMLTVRVVLRLLFLEDRKKRWHYIKRGFKDYSAKITGAYK